MALKRNTAEGQPDGTTLSAANSGGGSGDAFSTITPSGTVGRVFSTDFAAGGTQSYKITASASSALYCIATATAADTGACQMYLFLPAYPDNNQLFLNMRTNSSSVAGISVNQTGTIRISNSTSTINTSAAGVFPLYTWIRMDLFANVGADTSDGQVIAQLSVLDSLTPYWTYDSGATTNTGMSNITEYRFGKLDTTPNIAFFYFDNAAWNDGVTDFIDPYGNHAEVAWFGT